MTSFDYSTSLPEKRQLNRGIASEIGGRMS